MDKYNRPPMQYELGVGYGIINSLLLFIHSQLVGLLFD